MVAESKRTLRKRGEDAAGASGRGSSNLFPVRLVGKFNGDSDVKDITADIFMSKQ